MKEKKTVRERFEAKFVPGKKDECWEWKAAKIESGYGVIAITRGKTEYAHRLAWMLHYNRKIPKGMFICHHCDNPPCVNPHHLFLGTAHDNTQDMIRKGRINTKRRWAKLRDDDIVAIRCKAAQGVSDYDLAQEYDTTERYISAIRRGKVRKSADGPLTKTTCLPHTKLTPEQIIEMRIIYKSGLMTQQELADKYNVHYSGVYRICSGQRWGHITEAISDSRPAPSIPQSSALGSGSPDTLVLY